MKWVQWRLHVAFRVGGRGATHHRRGSAATKREGAVFVGGTEIEGARERCCSV
jgi:hypothetical protein